MGSKGAYQLPLQTISLVLSFMVWVILSSLMPFIKEEIELTSAQLAWATAIPVLFGSVLRIPVGYWTNRYGARKLFMISFVLLLAPVYWVSRADSFDIIPRSGMASSTASTASAIWGRRSRRSAPRSSPATLAGPTRS